MATKWHYCVRTGDLSQEALNEIGTDGWELTSVVAPMGEPVFYFKRPQPGLKESITLEQRERYFTERNEGQDSEA